MLGCLEKDSNESKKAPVAKGVDYLERKQQKIIEGKGELTQTKGTPVYLNADAGK